MNDIASLKENKDILFAAVLAGGVLGVLVSVLAVKAKERFLVAFHFFIFCWLGFWGWADSTLRSLFKNGYFVWMILCLQIFLQIFLIQQWMFVYHTDTGAGGHWEKYAYLPLTVVVPGFFANIFVGIATINRCLEIDKGIR